MKKSIKTAIFVSAVAAASLGGLKAYDLNMRSDVSNSDLLLVFGIKSTLIEFVTLPPQYKSVGL